MGAIATEKDEPDKNLLFVKKFLGIDEFGDVSERIRGEDQAGDWQLVVDNFLVENGRLELTIHRNDESINIKLDRDNIRDLACKLIHALG